MWLLSPAARAGAWSLIGVALFNAYMWAALTPFILRRAAHLVQTPARRAWQVTIVMAMGIVVAAIVAVLASSVHGGLPWMHDAGSRQRSFAFWALSQWYVEELVLFFGTLGVGILTTLLARYRSRELEAARLVAQTTQLEAERAELSARLADARLAVVRSQLNPHFLFNTLNAVSALVVKDPAGVRNIIALLSDLLRSALTDADEEEIELRREMELARRYLEILDIRFQGQLQTSLAMDSDTQDALVPRMILQPLIENAMKHGVAPADGDGQITIRARRSGVALELTVLDSGHGIAQSSAIDGTGSGLRLTRQRLEALYGADFTLELIPGGEDDTIARICLPYHTRADLRVAADDAR